MKFAVPRKLWWITLLVIVAGALRLIAVHETVINGPLRADAGEYFSSAYHLVQDGVYSRAPIQSDGRAVRPKPDAYRPPGVPLLLAPFMALWPDRDRVIACFEFLNVEMGIAAVLAVLLAGTRVLSPAAALAAAVLTATSPHLISMTVYLLSETPASFMLAVLLAVCSFGVPTDATRRTVYFLALGMLIGGLALFRPVFVAFAPLLALCFAEEADRRRALLLGVAGAAVVLAPWIIRGLVLGASAGGSSLAASTMLEGSYIDFMFNSDPSTFPRGADADPRSAQLRFDLIAVVKEGFAKFSADPLKYSIWYLFQKPVYLFQWNNIDGIGDVFVYPVTATPFWSNPILVALHRLHRLGHPLILLLATTGMVTAWLPTVAKSFSASQLAVLKLASLLVIFLYLSHIPFFVATRYLVPFLPVIYLLAVFAVTFLWRALRSAGFLNLGKL